MPPRLAEFQFAVIVARGRALTGRAFALSAVSSAHAAPPSVSAYVDYFGCEVRFGQPVDEAVLATGVLDLPLPSADPGLASVLDHRHRAPASCVLFSGRGRGRGRLPPVSRPLLLAEPAAARDGRLRRPRVTGKAIPSVTAAGGLLAGDLPLVVDVETTDGLAASVVTSQRQAWLNRVQQVTGRTPIIYTAAFMQTTLGSKFSSYPL